MAAEHQGWVTKLLGYDFEVKYRPGMENKVVDALSRMPKEVSLATLSIPKVITMAEIQQLVQDDEPLHKIVLDLEFDPDSHPSYRLVQGCYCTRDN